MMSLIGGILLFLLTVLAGYIIYRIKRNTGVRFLNSYAFPKELSARLLARHPEFTPAQVEFVFDALKQFFEIELIADKHAVAMPSRAVAELWHEFTLFDKEYQFFCQRTFGYNLYYSPAEAINSDGSQKESLCHTWKLACEMEREDPKSPQKVPLLFSVDGKLNFPDGFHYVADCGQARVHTGAHHLYCGADLCSGNN